MKGVIDIGSNSVLLLVAERDRAGELVIERDEARIARLSEGATRRRAFSPEAIGRTLAILRAYRGLIGEREFEAVATEGVRVVDDPESFLGPAAEILGQPVRVISGREEAELSYRSVAMEHGPGELRVVDIGGASTELVRGDGLELTSAVSHRIGSVRLTERFVEQDPPTPDAIAAIEAAVHEALGSQPMEPHEELHGLAGTVTTTAALLLGLEDYDRDRVDRSRFSFEVIEGLRNELAAEPLELRQRRPCLPPGRADVIVAGITILLAVLDHCGAGSLVVRDRGLRYALIV